ncbi:MAG: hypothetical protein IKH22_07020 [Prevotella sp.]|nr:hypothetical protein [Prevotella sp.]
MKYLLLFVLIVVVCVFIVVGCFFISFLIAFIKQRNDIAANGGIKTIYKILIDGLLEYSSARIIQDTKDVVTVGGTFTDPIFNRECGLWSVILQPTFKTLNVKYRARIYIGGGMTSKQMWDFPINMPQEQILSVIKKKADEFEVYGVFK